MRRESKSNYREYLGNSVLVCMRGCDFLMRWGNKEGNRRCGVKRKEYLVTPHKPPYNCEPGGEGWVRVARSKYRLQALSSFVCGGDTWYFERKKKKKKENTSFV